MSDQNAWLALTAKNPDHSSWYIERFRTMAAEGRDLDGEARLVDAMVARNSRILDAGCGPGRVGARLAELGHDVVGVDIDPVLIDQAIKDHAGSTWIVGDLAEVDLAAHGVNDRFDIIVSAGNVVTFLAPDTRRPVLANLRRHLADDGRLVVGFGSGRDYSFEEFFTDAESVGLVRDLELGTWDVRPFTESSDFLVAVMTRATVGEHEPARPSTS